MSNKKKTPEMGVFFLDLLLALSLLACNSARYDEVV